MVFTPLLTSACVGTLDLRSVAVPITSLQKHLREPQNNYFLASAQNVDPKKKTVQCKDEDGTEFDVAYDKLVIATGSQVVKHACMMQDRVAYAKRVAPCGSNLCTFRQATLQNMVHST